MQYVWLKFEYLCWNLVTIQINTFFFLRYYENLSNQYVALEVAL